MTYAWHKFDKLRELAIANGWDVTKLKGSKRKFLIRDGYEPNVLTYVYGEFEEHSLEEILFDHGFIRALCRAKEQGPDERLVEHYCTDMRIECPVWVKHIHTLAVSTDRIGYLYSEFIGEKLKTAAES